MEFSALERAVIEQILSQPVEGMDILREQFAAATVIDREYTGVGFYTTMSVPRSVRPAPQDERLETALQQSTAGTVCSAPGHAVLFMLWLDGGYLSCLEGVTTDDHWPDEREITLSNL